jgi:phospholipase A1/A2
MRCLNSAQLDKYGNLRKWLLIFVSGFSFLFSTELIADVESSYAFQPKLDLNFEDSFASEFRCDDQINTKTDQNEPDSKNLYLSPYKPNYILPGSRILNELEDREDTEIKFQLSMQVQLFELFGFQFFAAYTQKSFWQAFDDSKSRPFRETNYNPELMLRSPMVAFNHGHWGVIVGIEHESNGENLPYSRSWNRVYTRLLLFREPFRFDYKLWYRLPEDEKKNPEDTQGDDNPDIHHYYGYSETSVGFEFGKARVNVFGRMNAKEKKGAIQVDISYPFLKDRLDWYVQYWNGFGESLIDYNKSITRVGLGIMISKSNIDKQPNI